VCEDGGNGIRTGNGMCLGRGCSWIGSDGVEGSVYDPWNEEAKDGTCKGTCLGLGLTLSEVEGVTAGAELWENCMSLAGLRGSGGTGGGSSRENNEESETVCQVPTVEVDTRFSDGERRLLCSPHASPEEDRPKDVRPAVEGGFSGFPKLSEELKAELDV
jgi:hypothetical protein